jgi:plasmid rolling circle replication initiator protein Rep
VLKQKPPVRKTHKKKNSGPKIKDYYKNNLLSNSTTNLAIDGASMGQAEDIELN